MNSSGIKRGLAITAVAAVAVGTPAVVFAAGTGDADVYAVSQSADHPSLPQFSYATIDGTASAKTGADLYTGTNDAAGAKNLGVTISETLAAGTKVASDGLGTGAQTNVFSYDADGAGAGTATNVTWTQAGHPLVAATDLNSDGTLKSAITLTYSATTPFKTGTDGKVTNAFEYSVAAAYNGSETATTGTASAGGTATTSLTVTPVVSGDPTKVASISVSPASVNQYSTDATPVYTVKALDANGTPVDGVTVHVERGATPTILKGTATGQSFVVTDGTTGADNGVVTKLNSFGDTGAVTFTIPDSDNTKTTTDNLIFFVDEPSSQSTNADANDPQKTVSATFTKAPVAGTDYTVADATVKPADATLPADGASVQEKVTVKVVKDANTDLDNDPTTTPSDVTPVAGVNVAVDATDGGTYTQRVVGTTGADGTAVLTFTIPAVDADPSAPQTVTYHGYVTNDPTYGHSTGTPLPGAPTTAFEKRAYFVDFNNEVDSASSNPAVDNTASAQAQAGTTVSLPITVADQFGKPAANRTLAYTISNGRGNGTTAVPFTTDANGKYTITYTDKDTNAVTQAVHDTVSVYDPFGGTLGTGTTQATQTGDLNIDVQFLASLTADATNSKYGSGAVYSVTHTAPVTNTDPNAAPAADGTPSYGQVVSVDGAYIQAHGANDFYSVALVSTDGQPLKGQTVAFSAPGGILIDPSDPDNPAYGLGTLNVTTDQNGVASVLLTAITAGDVKLSATAGNFSHTFNPVRFDPDLAYNLSLASQPDSIAPGTSTKFVYNVVDQFGNKIYGTGPDGVNPNFDDAGTTNTGSAFPQAGSSDDVMGVWLTGSTGSATEPGTVNGAYDSTVDSNSQAVLVLTTLDSDKGTGTLVAKGNGNIATAAYAPAGAPSTLSALLKTYNIKSGLSTPFTVGETAPAKTTPYIKAGGKSLTQTTGRPGHKVKHYYDVINVRTNAPAGTRVTVLGQHKGVVAPGGKLTFKIKDKTPKSATTYKVTVDGTDTTNSASKTVRVS